MRRLSLSLAGLLTDAVGIEPRCWAGGALLTTAGVQSPRPGCRLRATPLRGPDDVRQARRTSGLDTRMDQPTVDEQGELVAVYRHQRERIDRFIEVGKQPAGERQRLILERGCRAVADDNIHSSRGNGDGDLAVGDLHRIRHDSNARVEDRLTGSDVVLPRVPGTAKDSPLVTIPEFVHVRGQRGPHHSTQADARCLMRTRVLERVEPSFQIENPDLSAFESDDLPSAGWNLVDTRHHVPGHQSTRRFGTSRRSPYTASALSTMTRRCNDSGRSRTISNGSPSSQLGYLLEKSNVC